MASASSVDKLAPAVCSHRSYNYFLDCMNMPTPMELSEVFDLVSVCESSKTVGLMPEAAMKEFYAICKVY